jgi:hypothetical protein
MNTYQKYLINNVVIVTYLYCHHVHMIVICSQVRRVSLLSPAFCSIGIYDNAHHYLVAEQLTQNLTAVSCLKRSVT